MKMDFFGRLALLAMAIAVPAKGALANGTLTPYPAIVPFERTLQGPEVVVDPRETGRLVSADPNCRRIVGSGPTITVTVKARVEYRCEGLFGEYTIICNGYDPHCPPRRLTYVLAIESSYGIVPGYSVAINRLPEEPDSPPFCGPYCPIVNEALENPPSFKDEPVSATALSPHSSYWSVPLSIGGELGLMEAERDGQEESAWSVGTIGFGVGHGIRTGYGHDDEMGGVRMGYGSDLGIDGFRGTAGVTADWMESVDPELRRTRHHDPSGTTS